MNRFRAQVLVLAWLPLGLLVPARGWAASLVQVNKSDWTGGVSVPSYVQMYIYVPDNLAAKPPIMVSSHSCGSNAMGQMGNIPKSQEASDANGFIMILPDNPGQNCWDVGTTQALTHDGGSDTKAVVQMVKYALMKYNGDAARVYAMGGSSGAMMTQALMAVYPDVFRAGSARAGVPAGCWADGYASSNQWSNNCAGGSTSKTAMAWGDLVRNMFPGYTGHRPRVQIMQGEADTTISYKNTAESIKEWTNVLELDTAPTSTDMGYKAAGATYNRQFWKNECGFTVFEAWSSPGGTHSMPYEEADILKFFGLDVASGTDPEPDCNGMGGSGGASATGGMGGMAVVAGASGMGGTLGVGGNNPGGAGPSAGGGGMTMSAGSGGVLGGAGGGSGSGGRAAGGSPATGSGGTGGSATGGSGMPGVAGGIAKGGGSGSSGTSAVDPSGTDPETASGCGCTVGDSRRQRTYSAALALGLAVVAFRRRQRRAQS
jgi:poly(hydroxyalkanoate) depolymerase family esterase